MMLSNFIRRTGKRKGNKAYGSRLHQKSSSASSSIAPSLVFNISEESSSQSAAQCSRLVELDLSNSDEEWFPQELLQRSSSPHSQNAAVARRNSAQESYTDPSSVTSCSPSESVPPGVAFRKKSIPAPILIPDTGLMPYVQIGHSAVPSALPPTETSQPNVNHPPSNPSSPSTSENLSAISGTTLARALIGSSFVLSSNERHNSRHRSGLVRQDSATLPRGELGSLHGSGRSSPIPPVPPVPAMLFAPKPNYPSPVKSGASTESEYPVSDSYVTSPEIVTSSVIPRRASRTMSTEPSPPVVPDVTSQRKARNVPAWAPVTKDSTFNGPITAIEVPLPNNSGAAAQHSPQEGSDNHALDRFDFVSPESSVVGASPNSGANASDNIPLPKRSDANRRTVGSGLVLKGCMIRSLPHSTSESKNFSTAKFNSLASGIVSSDQGYGLSSATISEHDYGELLNCNLTFSPGSSASSLFPSSSSAGYQTFPETPTVFSPLCSPVYSPLAKSESQIHRRRPPSVKPSRLRSGKLYPSTRVVRRQLSNKSGPASAPALRRSQSSFVPSQKAPPLNEAGVKPSFSAQVNSEPSITEETDHPSMTHGVESKKSVEERLAIRHPLAHVSTSSSCLPEEEALLTLAPHSASSLSPIPVDHVDALIGLLTIPSVIDSSAKSPTSVPLPESTNVSPSSSPALVDSVMQTSQLTSPLRSPIPTTASAVASSPFPLISPTSVPFSSLGVPSFLPFPSPPASPNELLFPRPMAPSRAGLDESGFPSPSFIPPPPYHTIVSERTAHHPDSISTPSMSRTSSAECFCRQHSNSSSTSGSVRTRARARPPLPIGPRKQSKPGQIFNPFDPGRVRNGSTSSVTSGDPIGSPGSLWHKLQSVVSKPPRFQPPPPKWRGLKLEAAQWTFTSEQLREIVSRAIQQASEGSTLRLLRLEMLDGEITEEVHRLELQHTDVKAQYKAFVRKRWTLMGALASHIEGVDMNDATTVCRTMEELAEVSSTLDRLADKMHSIVLQMAQLRSLRDVHNASALAMAVRKINGLFVKQMAEKERLQEKVDTLRTERDEAWKQAEDIAQDYDTLNDRMSETGDVKAHTETQSLAGSRRSARVSASRKSSVRLSQAGLRSRGRHRPSRSSSNATRPSSPASEGIPPVPRMREKPLSMGTVALPSATTTSVFSGTSSSTSEALLALAEAQREVYEMLGLSVPPTPVMSRRRRTLSGPDHAMPSPGSSRPLSDSLNEIDLCARRGQGGRFREDGDRGASSWTV